MLRQIFLEEPMKQVFYEGSPQAMAAKERYIVDNGIVLYIGDYHISTTIMILSLIGIAALFFMLSVLRLSKNKL